MIKTAIFSEDRIYRYTLYRGWENGKTLAIIGLNPSTADEIQDDPTIRRCIRYAKDWGFGALYMLNLFAFRATLPSVMKSSNEPIGIDNDYWIRIVCGEMSDMTLIAWGNHGSYLSRDKQVLSIVSNPYCLGVTKTGQPKHPLYLPSALKPKHFENTGIGKIP